MPALRPNNGEWGYGEWRDTSYGARCAAIDIHLPPEAGEEAILDFDEADDDIMAMHYRLTDEDEEYGEELLCDEHLRWMLDEELIEQYWQGLLASVRGAMSTIYDSVKAYDGTFVPVLRARGAHRIEHVFQVHAFLAYLHQTRWYRPSPQEG